MQRALLGGIAIATIAWVVLWSGEGRASAQARPPTLEALERASVLFERSALAYAEGRFDAAVTLLDEAYALSREPVLLYNLGRAHEGARQPDRALDAYRRYLERAPAGPNAAAVRERIAVIEAALAAEAAERERRARAQAAREADAAERAAEEAATAAEAEEARRRAEEERRQAIDPWPWVIAGSGGAALIASAVVGGIAVERRDRAEDATIQTEARALFDEAQELAIGANIGLVVGGVLLGGGLTWGIVGLAQSGESRDAAPAVEVTFGPTGASVRGSF